MKNSNVLSMLKPNIKTITLRNDERERVKYLDVDENIGMEQLRADIELGARQFESIIDIVEKEKTPQFILITADNLEQAYMAVTYMEAIFEEKETSYSSELSDNAEEWRENPYRIPIITEEDLTRDAYENREVFEFGPMFMQGRGKKKSSKPFWEKCERDAICVVSSDKRVGFWNLGEKNEILETALEQFLKNKRVFVINHESRMEWDSWCDEEDVIWEREKWNDFILDFTAEEVQVELKISKAHTYYKRLLEGNIWAQEKKVEPNFAADKIIDKIIQMNDENKCVLIERIVNYALKDKEKDDVLLRNEDFEFLERFIRTRGRRKGKKRNMESNLSAKKQLEENLVGMQAVKEQVKKIVNVMKYNKIRAGMRLRMNSYHNVHMMLGAPGTAKTTVAKLMGQIMVEENLLPDDRFICINGAELKGKYVGHSAPKTKQLFEDYDIIVIDEAYSIVGENGTEDSFSNEAIAQLIIELEEHSMDKLVIFAGYGGKYMEESGNRMKLFLDSNPGIRSRITSTIFFESYSETEVTEVFFALAKNQNYEVDKNAEKILIDYFSKRVSKKDFGNGREARRLLEAAVVYAAERVLQKEGKRYTKKDMSEIFCEDIEKAICQLEKTEELSSVDKKTVMGFLR